MNNVGIFPPADPGPDGAGPTSRPGAGPSSRRPLLIVSICLCLAVVVAGTVVILTWPDEDAPLVINQPDAVIWGRTINGPVEIAADDVTLRGVTIRTGGPAAIRVRPGAAGAVIQDTEIYCAGRQTDGIVPGGYAAVRVATHGCGRSFTQTPDAVSTVVDSAQDGRPYSPDEPLPGSPNPDTPTPSFDPTVAAPGSSPTVAGTPASPGRPATVDPPTPLSYWPGPDTTGPTAGTRLTPSGSLELREPGQTITNLDIQGCVTVRAHNVTIRQSRISCNSPLSSVRMYGGATNLHLEDVEIDGRGQNAFAICCGNYTLRRVDIHDVIDGPRLGSRSTVVDSWIHDLARVPSSHNDTLQTTGGSDIVIRHNRLEPYRPSTRDPFNACLMLGSTSGPAVRDLVFEDNYCNGGNYSIGIRPDLIAANVVFEANRFGRDYRYAVVARPDHRGLRWDRASNVWYDSGQPVL